jgi:hypothetical protein
MRSIVAVVVLCVCTACGSEAGTPSGGVQGRVTSGPTCPVEIQGSPCPPAVWTGTVRATAPDGAVHETTTGADGSYRLALQPGTYTVTPVVPGGGPPAAKPVTVVVGDSMQTVDLQVDSGIR